MVLTILMQTPTISMTIFLNLNFFVKCISWLKPQTNLWCYKAFLVLCEPNLKTKSKTEDCVFRVRYQEPRQHEPVYCFRGNICILFTTMCNHISKTCFSVFETIEDSVALIAVSRPAKKVPKKSFKPTDLKICSRYQSFYHLWKQPASALHSGARNRWYVFLLKIEFGRNLTCWSTLFVQLSLSDPSWNV